MPIRRERHPSRRRWAGPAVLLAVLACLAAPGPAAASVSYTGDTEPPAPTRSGNTLISATGEWVCVPDCLPPTYEWQRCTTVCTTVTGRTGRVYTLSAADLGTRIRSLITERDSLFIASETRASAQTATITAEQPAPTPAARRLSPFPVVVLAGRLRGTRTVVDQLTIRGPRRARVSVRCRGRGCPIRRTGGTIGRRKRIRVRAAERSYRAGTVLEIRVTGRNRIGKFTRIRFRSRRAPSRRDLCLMPGARRATACP